MRVAESVLRSVVRNVILEAPKQYDHINSYEELESMYGAWNGQLTKLKYKIAWAMFDETSVNKETQLVDVYEEMCMDAGLLAYADEIIADAREIFKDPYFGR